MELLIYPGDGGNVAPRCYQYDTGAVACLFGFDQSKYALQGYDTPIFQFYDHTTLDKLTALSSAWERAWQQREDAVHQFLDTTDYDQHCARIQSEIDTLNAACSVTSVYDSVEDSWRAQIPADKVQAPGVLAVYFVLISSADITSRKFKTIYVGQIPVFPKPKTKQTQTDGAEEE